jgi:hypothetical protein
VALHKRTAPVCLRVHAHPSDKSCAQADKRKDVACSVSSRRICRRPSGPRTRLGGTSSAPGRLSWAGGLPRCIRSASSAESSMALRSRGRPQLSASTLQPPAMSCQLAVGAPGRYDGARCAIVRRYPTSYKNGGESLRNRDASSTSCRDGRAVQGGGFRCRSSSEGASSNLAFDKN